MNGIDLSGWDVGKLIEEKNWAVTSAYLAAVSQQYLVITVVCDIVPRTINLAQDFKVGDPNGAVVGGVVAVRWAPVDATWLGFNDQTSSFNYLVLIYPADQHIG